MDPMVHLSFARSRPPNCCIVGRPCALVVWYWYAFVEGLTLEDNALIIN